MAHFTSLWPFWCCLGSSKRTENASFIFLLKIIFWQFEVDRNCWNLVVFRALERIGVETSQLALARRVMRGVLGRERSRGRTVEKWRVKIKFCSTYKVHWYGWTVRHFSLPFGSGHLYTIFKLSVLNNRIVVSQIKVIILNKFNFSEIGCGFCSSAVINLKFSFALKQLKAQSLEFKQIFYSSFRCPNFRFEDFWTF